MSVGPLVRTLNRCLRLDHATSNLALSPSRDGEPTVSLDNMLQCLTILSFWYGQSQHDCTQSVLRKA